MTSNESPAEPEHPSPGVPVAPEPVDTAEGFPLTANLVKALIAKVID